MNRVDAISRGMTDKALDSVEIPSLEGKVSDEEWAIRVDLAAAYRMPSTIAIPNHRTCAPIFTNAIPSPRADERTI